MDEMISSSSSPFNIYPETSATLKESLQLLLQTRPESWVYSIFWKASKDSTNGVSLSWAGGDFRGNMEPLSKGSSIHKLDNNYPPKFGFNLDTPQKSIDREIEALFHDQDLELERFVDTYQDVTSSEWFYFYTVSLTQSFAAGLDVSSNILGRAYCSGAFIWLAGAHELQFYECERVKEAHMHGIQTLVCVATSNGVLEMASLDVIKEHWGFVQQAKSLFTGISDSSSNLQGSHDSGTSKTGSSCSH